MKKACIAAALSLAAVTGCEKPVRTRVPDGVEVQLGDAWFRARAQALGVTVDEARARDAALAEEAPPEGVWDEQTRAQAAALWSALCAECHGLEGDLAGVPVTGRMPRRWGTVGTRMGFFFGGDKMRAGIFKTIADGAPDDEDGPSPMIAWRPMLAKEQIWALVHYIEGF